MEDPLHVQVGGAHIYGHPRLITPDLFGLFIAKDGWDGWDDGGGEARVESVARPGMHGEFDLPVLMGASVFSIDGWALAPSAFMLGRLRSTVMGIGADGQLMRATVHHQEQTLWADVRRAVKPTFKDAGVRHGLLRARFFLQFRAPDPRKYGETVDFPGGEKAVQYGNFPARPDLIVTGTAASGYTVTGPGGRRVVVTKALTAGAPHTISFAKGGLWVGGVRQLRAISMYEPWTVPPTAVGAVATVDNGVSLVQRVTDTFV